MPKASWRTLTIGARQLVVHEALEMIRCSAFSVWSLTPRTIVASSLSLAGALRMTRSAPASMCFWSDALLVKKPVDSRATWHSRAFHGRFAGSFSWVIRISLPLTTRRVGAGLDGAVEPPVDAVVLQEQGQVLGVRQVVDRDDLDTPPASRPWRGRRAARSDRIH